MPRLPRNVSGDELIRRLRAYGYETTRQSSSHVRLTRKTLQEQHHVTVPMHRSLRVGTLNSILSDVADHLGQSKADLVAALFG